jgi:hypothetical protein
MNKNYGLILEKPNELDYMFGADNDIGKKVLMHDRNWTAYLPTGEKQSHLYHDDYGCVTHSAQNVIECIFNYKIEQGLFSEENIEWLNKNGYVDDRNKVNFDDFFIANLSKTKCNVGNTYRRVADTIREYGLTPQINRPQATSCSHWYQRPITDQELELGKQFKLRFKINYETVIRGAFNNALKYSPLQVGVNAWFKQNGLYYNEVKKWNHAVTYFRKPVEIQFIFDSYGKSTEDSFIKRLTKDYLFGKWAYAYYVKDINYKTDMQIKLYKEEGSSTVYARGEDMGDGKYHPIGQSDFVMMFANSWDELNVTETKISKSEIGDMIGSYGFLQRVLNNLFNK